MIPRYTNPEMGRIWTDQHRYETWLLVETAAAEAMAEAGMIPAEAARDIRERGAVDIARVEEIEATTQHDLIAFTTAVAERVGDSARWLHFGLTSSDVLDTALALQMLEACDLILLDLKTLRSYSDSCGGAPQDSDGRADPRCACRADDFRFEAGSLARRVGSQSTAAKPGSRGN